MSQTILNSQHFQRSGETRVMAAVPFMDATLPKQATPAASRYAMWPMALIALGAVATLAWSGFLIWQTVLTLGGWIAAGV